MKPLRINTIATDKCYLTSDQKNQRSNNNQINIKQNGFFHINLTVVARKENKTANWILLGGLSNIDELKLEDITTIAMKDKAPNWNVGLELDESNGCFSLFFEGEAGVKVVASISTTEVM